MVWKRSAVLAALGLALGGCELILGIDDPTLEEDTGDGDTGELPDAGITEPRNPLGILCGPRHADNGFGGDCPSGGLCVPSIADIGDPELMSGYCSPDCTGGGDAVCQEAYPGPPEGQPICGLRSSDGTRMVCAIGFPPAACAELGSVVCPEGLECMMFDDGSGGTNLGCGDQIWGPLP